MYTLLNLQRVKERVAWKYEGVMTSEMFNDIVEESEIIYDLLIKLRSLRMMISVLDLNNDEDRVLFDKYSKMMSRIESKKIIKNY